VSASAGAQVLPGAGRTSWPAQQLAEFLAVVSAHSDPAAATLAAVELVAEALHLEVAAVVRAGCKIVSTGCPDGRAPADLLLGLAAGREAETVLPGLGRCAVAREPLDQERLAWLLVACTGRELSGEERDLLRGMARVLGLAREMLGRRRLLERVSEIQRQIVRRAPASEVIDTIVSGAAELTDSDIAMMRRADPFDRLATPAVAGFGDDASDAVHAAIAAPVSELDAVVGSLIVGSRNAGRRYSASERAALQTFAEHASVALGDAHMVQDAVHRAMHDALTELPNRALFADRLEQALHRAERKRTKVAVLFLDIDRFKTVNDSLGHAAGDELLVAAAGRLRRCTRPGDTAARFGGDEFAVLVEEADEHVGARLADRILQAFDEPFTVQGRAVRLGASIGIAIAERPGDDPLRDGDLAMYHAKSHGRGRHELFRPALREAAQERLELESELRGAGERGELLLEYQPIVELRTKQVYGLEALVRWQHPTRGLLAPEAFIPIAEETREMAELGRWILHSACEQAERWRRLSGERPLIVSVNLSPTQLHATDVVADVLAALRETGLPAASLVLELTETAIMEDVVATAECLRHLKRIGVSVAMDDFGTGYCSLQYLRGFPIDYLKIAKSFVEDLARPVTDPALTRAIIELGDNFGAIVVAEGVEHPRQREWLIDLGCDLGQGYLFGRPRAPALVGPHAGTAARPL
jgi:diguanylate cyclase (GGDEF)-like protein